MPQPNIVYIDKAACVAWSKNTTTKGLRHIQIRDNAVRESIQNGFANVLHVAGNMNLADLFTKEDRDDKHFLSIRDILVTARRLRVDRLHPRGVLSWENAPDHTLDLRRHILALQLTIK